MTVMGVIPTDRESFRYRSSYYINRAAKTVQIGIGSSVNQQTNITRRLASVIQSPEFVTCLRVISAVTFGTIMLSK